MVAWIVRSAGKVQELRQQVNDIQAKEAKLQELLEPADEGKRSGNVEDEAREHMMGP
jgi:hypothetical protein